ncbi:hypothetical protein [Clostridium tertium]
MEWDAIAIIVSLFSLLISCITNRKSNELEKQKNKPIFYIRSTMENMGDRYIEIELITLRYKDIRNIGFKWVGEKEVKIKYNKTLKNEEDNIWNYTIILDINDTNKEKDINGKIIIECSTLYEKRIKFYKDINICSKYYPLVEEYSQELRKVASTEFKEI